jgi:hypothetical protein
MFTESGYVWPWLLRKHDVNPLFFHDERDRFVVISVFVRPHIYLLEHEHEMFVFGPT